MLKIDRGVPIPEKLQGGRPRRFDFSEMRVKDSVQASDDLEFRDMRSAAYRWGKEHGWKFTARTLPDGSFRLWRVK